MGGTRLALAPLLLGACLCACGGDSGTASVDAGSTVDSPSGTMPDAPGGQSGCDYTEAADSSNTSVNASETTNLTLGTKLTICGAINNGHYGQNSTPDLVDADGYFFTIAADTDVLMHIDGSGLATAEASGIQILKMGVNAIYGFGVVEGTHGTLVARLTAGTYVAAVSSFNPSDLGAPISYKVIITPDTPATRCAKKTGGDYAESADGGSNNGNDVINYNFTSNTPSTLTTATTDAPETSNLTVAAATSYLVTGTAANVNPADDYMDRDTFAFTTGPSTTQMSIRLNWTSTNADFDYRVYPVSTSSPLSIVGGLRTSNSEDEFQTFAVKPSTTYWLWVALSDGATAPATYGATLCGESFSP